MSTAEGGGRRPSKSSFDAATHDINGTDSDPDDNAFRKVFVSGFRRGLTETPESSSVASGSGAGGARRVGWVINRSVMI